IRAGFANPEHIKHVWLRSLARSVARWPGPVLVLWMDPSPGFSTGLSPAHLQDVAQMNAFGRKLFEGQGKANLRFVGIRDVLPDAHDYVDGDHLTAQGHSKLAAFVQGATR